MNQNQKEWHVWHVGYSFYAAETLEDAIQAEMDAGADRGDISWDDDHCDHSDFFNGTEGEGDAICMCARAQQLIDEGRKMPFEFARELDN
jgi:hypothetical protein